MALSHATRVPAGSGGNRVSGRRLLAALAITQTIGYGALYYAFAVILAPLAADLHTTTTAVTGALTVSVLTGAVLAVPIGRWLDRHGGHTLMTAGSAAGAALLVAWSHVDSLWQLYAVLVGIGAASAASLYEAAFAVVIGWFTPERRSTAVLAITVVAGFASTVFMPLTGYLVDRHGWRTALLVLAAVQAVTVPLHALTVPRTARTRERTQRTPTRDAGTLRAALADRAFWLLAAGFTAHTAAITGLSVHLVAALTAWGHPPAFAATVAGLLGVLSVTGRLVTTGLQRRYRTTTITAAIFAVQGAAALALPIVGATIAGAIGAVIGFGIGFGVATIAKPVLLAERYDTHRYATLAGILVVPMTLAKAAAPLAAAAVHTSVGSYTPVLAATAACCAVAAAAIAASGRLTTAPSA
ncbi:Predicted arabinose efflux permease, MFS family [Micromonospora pattaloongensis]|uniref:Predicted arabinose efflux permease, MFS family n=2 Tax=Micromonospora pattaloongensis TaxID=405436 RepID=A0A1H3PAE2_9ACTN|nr:Predicted arabinose efflux permease, MFS family [Micromonospora pattaloongensis]